MKKLLVLTATIALVAGVITGMFLSLRTNSTVHANSGQTIHVVEHAITDTVQHFHPPHDSLGDVLAFHNPVFDAQDKKQVGEDNGQCIRTVVKGKKEWECFWTVFLAQGQITVEGPYYDDGTDTTLANGGQGADATTCNRQSSWLRVRLYLYAGRLEDWKTVGTGGRGSCVLPQTA